MFEAREGEIALAYDPAAMAADAHLVFIGSIRSPWKTRADCPKNMAAARPQPSRQGPSPGLSRPPAPQTYLTLIRNVRAIFLSACDISGCQAVEMHIKISLYLNCRDGNMTATP